MPDTADAIPSLAQWAGGEEAISRLFVRFYERVPSHPLLAPVFSAMAQHHAEQVAAFVGEVLGGDKHYSAAGGSHAGMIARHIGRHLTEEQRRAWARCCSTRPMKSACRPIRNSARALLGIS